MKRERVAHGTIESPETNEEQLPCDVCGLWYPEDPSSTDMRFMSTRELEILDAMRLVKHEAREVKQALGDIIEDRKPGPELQKRLRDLQERWRQLESERTAAAEERMRMLGHKGA